MFYIFKRSKNISIDIENPLLRDLLTDFFDIDFFYSAFFNFFLKAIQFI